MEWKSIHVVLGKLQCMPGVGRGAGVPWLKTAGPQEEGLGNICANLVALLQCMPQRCSTSLCMRRRQCIYAEILDASL